MKKILGIILTFFVLTACSKKQNSLDDYESHILKFPKSKINAKNGEFSMSLPQGWHINQDLIESDTMLYMLQAISNETNFVCLVIYKMNVIYGDIDTEFEEYIYRMTNQASNVKLLEKATIKISNITAKTALLRYEHNGMVAKEEIDIFIPFNKGQYYSIGLISDRNDKIGDNFGMMLECAKSFQLKKEL